MKFQHKQVLGILSAAALAFVVKGRAMAAEGPSLSGFVDFGYNYNFNGKQTNTLRSFDVNANSFILQNAKLTAEGKSSKDVGYRVDLSFGNDPQIFNASNAFSGPAYDFEQAFITVVCPVTKGTFTFGKFVTPFGAEVIDAKDDMNISRGDLFNYAIPLHHTGIKYDKSFGDLGLTAGVVNGWDNVRDNNTGKTLLFQANKPLGDKVKVTLGGAYGPEQTDAVFTSSATTTNGKSRSVVDAIVSFNPSAKLSFVANADWGVEEGLTGLSKTNPTQNWEGVALFGKYAFNDMHSLALRVENLDDEGSRTLTAAGHVVLNSLTATFECKKNDVITRLELRQDTSNKKVYTDSDGKASDSQTTVALQWIYAF